MNDVAVIVGSCDKYRFAWPPLCHGLSKYWPDPPWPVYIVTNYLDAPCGQTLKIGDDPGWTGMARLALRTIDKPVVLWMDDDVWLTAPPKTQNLMDWAEIILKGEADYICLGQGLTRGKTFPGDPRLFIVSAKCKWRITLAPSLWRTSYFLELLGPDRESCWTFETMGNRRLRSDDGRRLSARDNLSWRWPNDLDPDWPSGWKTPIVRGRWTRTAREYAEREGITIDWKSNPHGRKGDWKHF